MTDNLRVEALRLATIQPDDPDSTVGRAAAYLAFLTGDGGASASTVDAIAGTAEASKAPPKATKPKATPAPAPEPDPVEEEPTAAEFTIDQVRAALKEYRAIEGAPAMMTVLKNQGGAEALTGVDPSKYPAIMEAIGAA